MRGCRFLPLRAKVPKTHKDVVKTARTTMLPTEKAMGMYAITLNQRALLNLINFIAGAEAGIKKVLTDAF
jgi:hypothetical protein